MICFLSNIWYIISDFFKGLSSDFWGAFWGALFAFIFFLIGEKIIRKWNWNKEVSKEHAFLERYLGNVNSDHHYNKGLIKIFKKDYTSNVSSLMEFSLYPIREDSTMKMKDNIFINKIEFYNGDLRRLNRTLSTMNNWKDKINQDLMSDSLEIKSRGKKMVESFLNELDVAEKGFGFHIETTLELMTENRLLLKSYKNWSYNPKKMGDDFLSRKKEVENEMDTLKGEFTKNPIFDERLLKLKKYGLINDDQEN